MNFDNDADEILFNQWMKTEDCMQSYEQWKKKCAAKTKKIKKEEPSNTPQKIEKGYSAENPPLGQAYLYSPEFASWCAHRDAQGKDY